MVRHYINVGINHTRFYHPQMTSTYFQWYDPRYGDTYEIYTDPEGDFHSARRSTGRFGSEPIYYDSLAEIPPFHRATIESQLAERKKKQ